MHEEECMTMHRPALPMVAQVFQADRQTGVPTFTAWAMWVSAMLSKTRYTTRIESNQPAAAEARGGLANGAGRPPPRCP